VTVPHAAPIQVFVLTFCRRLDLFYGTELIFRTLRTGFPNARITVVDNASLPEVRPRIARLAREQDCAFRQIPGPDIPHDRFLEETLVAVAEQGGGRVVFLDPDLCLWRSCEDLDPGGLIAGAHVGAHEDPVMQCVTMPRLHTSFLWIPDALALAQEIHRIRKPHFDFRPFQPVSFKLGDVWIRYDTGAGLLAAIPDRITSFGEPEFDRYDHIFCGSHFDLHDPHWTGELRDLMRRIHADAREGRIEALRGIWREQRRVLDLTFGPVSLGRPPER
jgi:hypothetical protein